MKKIPTLFCTYVLLEMSYDATASKLRKRKKVAVGHASWINVFYNDGINQKG